MDLAYREAYAMNPQAARMRLVETYLETGSVAETARRWHTSRNVVRKWVERYREDGVKGLGDRSRPPRPTIRHILHRNGFRERKRERKTFYPAHWAWEEQPFTLADVKDVLDKGALGTKLWDHLAKRKLPRYQWTFLEGRTRLRFLAWSHEISLTNGLCFMSLVMLWLRGHGIEREVAWQTDWGEGFGGSNPDKLHRLQEKHYEPVGARLVRIQTEEGFLRKATGWVYSYNLERPHFGKGLDGKPPFRKLRERGYDLPEEFALFPSLVLDRISPDWALRGGNDLLAHCTTLPG